MAPLAPAASWAARKSKIGASKQAHAHRVRRVRTRALRSATALVKAKAAAVILPSRLRKRGVVVAAVPATSSAPGATRAQPLTKPGRHGTARHGRASAAVPTPAKLAKLAEPPKPRPPHKDKPFRKAGLYAGDHPHRLPLSEHPLILAALNLRRKTPSRKSLGGRKHAMTPTSDEQRLPSEYARQFPPLPFTWHADDEFDAEEFRLPFDILHDWEQGELGTKKVPQKYVKVKKNVYVDRRPHSDPDISAICNCAPTSGCGEHCLNRAMSFTCGKDCPCGDGCTNQPLSKRQQAPYKIYWTGKRGFGLCATAPIKKGEFIMDYRGEVIEMNTYYARIRNVYQGRKDFYALAYDADEVIDAGLKGNDARFMNHSCGPNLQVRKLQTMGQGSEEFEVGFWAERDIAPGEELFYNYNFDSFTTIVRPSTHPDFMEDPVERRQKCFCGAASCSGWLGKKATDKGEDEEKPTGKGVKLASRKVKRTLVKKVGPARPARTKVVRADKVAGASVVKRAITKVRAATKKTQLKAALRTPVAASRAARAAAANGKHANPSGIPTRAGSRRASTQSQGKVAIAVPLRSKRIKAVKDCGSTDVASPPHNISGQSSAILDGKRKSMKRAVAEQVPDSQGAAGGPASTRRGRTSSRTVGRSLNLDTLPASVGPPQISISACTSEADSSEVTPSLTTGLSRSSVALEEPASAVVDDVAVIASDSASSTDSFGRTALSKIEPVPAASFAAVSGAAIGGGGNSDLVDRAAWVELLAIASEAPARPTELIVATAHVTISVSQGWQTVAATPAKQLQFSLEQLFGLTGDRASAKNCEASRDPPGLSNSRDPPPNPSARIPRTAALASTDAEQAPTSDIDPGSGSGGDQDNAGGAGEGSHGAGQDGNAGDAPAGDAGSLGFAGGPGGDDGEDPNNRQSGQDVSGDQAETTDDESSGDESEQQEMGEDHLLPQPPSPTTILNSALAMNGGYIPEDLTLDSLSRQPDLAALTAQGIQLPDLSAAFGELPEAEPPAKKRKGKSRLAQMPPDEMSPHEIAQRMVDEVARSAARAEKRRLRREAESSGKKRRNKWHLPLETEQLEIERKKKKKGQKWMEAMKSLVEQKRAAAGLPVQDNPAERLTSVEVSGEPQRLNMAQDNEQGPEHEQGREHQTEHAHEHEKAGDHDAASEQNHSANGAETASTLSEDTHAEEVEVDVGNNSAAANPADPPAKPKPKRIRKPRPPRRFKTTLTRLRPKLEAALSSVTIEEEEAALERERRRRKKGTAWLEAMKALARAKREAAEAAEQGLPPPDFVLPPTSFPPSGRRRSKKSRQPGDEHDEEDSDEDHSLPLVDTQAEVAALMPPGRQPLIEEPLESDLPGGIPAFMFPPDHPAAQGHRRETEQIQAEHTGLPEYLDPNIMADAAATAATFTDRSQDGTGQAGDSSAIPFTEYVPQFSAGEGDQGHADYANASGSNPAGQYVQPEYRFDEHASQYTEHAFQQPQETHMADGQVANEYQQDFAGLPMQPQSYSLPNFDAFTGHQVQGSGVDQPMPQLPPVPVVYKPSETQKANGEKRKRGPPVKKIAGSTLEPLTDEQWEAERKKRKKGYNWVAETKAAAAAEREQLELARSGIKLPRKPKGQRAAASALAAAAVAVAEEASQEQSYLEQQQEQHHDLPFSGLDLESLHQTGTHSATPGQEAAPEPDDVLPYPTMTSSLIQDQPYPALNQSFDTSAAQGYGLDMYNPTEDVEGYGAAATADQIYNAMHPYRNDGE